jgi:hypothetical protein
MRRKRVGPLQSSQFLPLVFIPLWFQIAIGVKKNVKERKKVISAYFPAQTSDRSYKRIRRFFPTGILKEL